MRDNSLCNDSKSKQSRHVRNFQRYDMAFEVNNVLFADAVCFEIGSAPIAVFGIAQWRLQRLV